MLGMSSCPVRWCRWNRRRRGIYSSWTCRASAPPRYVSLKARQGKTLMTQKVKCAIIGSGNIGTDLMVKLINKGKLLELVSVVGIDPESDGLAKARARGLEAIDNGIDGLVASPHYRDIGIVFDATSAYAHKHHNEILARDGKGVIDLTPAAIGPLTIPPVNGEANLDAQNVNMVTCGGQATIPMVAAVSRVSRGGYAAIVAS